MGDDSETNRAPEGASDTESKLSQLFPPSISIDEDERSDLSDMSEMGKSPSLGGGVPGVQRKVVRLLIKGAKNLREIPGKKKIVAPYLVVGLNGQKETLKAKLQNTMMPAWNAKAQLLYGTDRDENILTLKFYDQKGQTKDEFLGEVVLELSKLDHKKKRFEYKDQKLTHPKEEFQGKVHFIMLISERTFAPDSPEALAITSPPPPTHSPKPKDKKLRKSSNGSEKGSTRKRKPVTEKRTVDTTAGIAAPPDLLWKFISNFHDVEEWLPKMPCEALPSQDEKMLRKIKYPDHEVEILEQLDAKDDTSMTLRWSSVTLKEGEKGLAGTVGYSVTLVIVPVGRARSRLTWTVEYEIPVNADDGVAKKFFENLVEMGMDGLKVAAEG